MPAMRTLFVTDPPIQVEDWLARRRALGQDRFDEVWEGEYHVAPAPSGRHAQVDDRLGWVLRPTRRARGPARRHVLQHRHARTSGSQTGVLPRGRPGRWNPTAAIVVEVVSPGDESRRKLDFYHRVGVEEVLIVDPDARTVEWFTRGPDAFRPADGSILLGITITADLAARIDWPPASWPTGITPPVAWPGLRSGDIARPSAASRR